MNVLTSCLMPTHSFDNGTFVRNKSSLDFAVRFYQINHQNPSAFDDPEVNLDALRFRAISNEEIEVAA